MNVKFSRPATTTVADLKPGETFRIRDTVYLRIAINPTKYTMPVAPPLAAVIDIITGELVPISLDTIVHKIEGRFVEGA